MTAEKQRALADAYEDVRVMATEDASFLSTQGNL